MATITIDGTDFDTYVDLDAANTYLKGQISAASWLAETDEDQKARAIVSATRFIDRQRWQGTKTDSAQAHAFPRQGLTYADSGDAVASDSVPQEVLDATCELASALLDGSEVQTNTQPNSNLTQSLKAGSVAISYFRGDDQAGRFPQIIQELLGFWLAGSIVAASSIATGTDRESRFENEDRFTVNRGI